MILPPNFSNITPYLVVDNAQQYLTFLINGLGGEFLGQHIDTDGRIKNAQVRFHQSTLMLSDSSAQFKATTGHYLLYVADVHHTTATATAAGATLVMAAAAQPYGDIQAGIVDGAHNHWWITQRLEAKPYY
jgi:PhnB protein